MQKQRPDQKADHPYAPAYHVWEKILYVIVPDVFFFVFDF